MDRIFLDANVLFSAAYLENSGLGRLWQLEDAELLSSAYALEEARRNLALERPPALARLERLTTKLTLVNPPVDRKLPAGVRLDSKDRPILLAAIHGKADFLLTGDGRHFGHLYGKRIEGVMVLRPAQCFERRARRLERVPEAQVKRLYKGRNGSAKISEAARGPLEPVVQSFRLPA